MATVEHSLLTGASLHEPKGVDAATASTVYVADGIGSGAWTALTTFNPFGNQLFHVRDQVSSGTASQGNLTDATWNTRRLQTTITNEITSASLASNQLSLPEGTYFVQGWALHYYAPAAAVSASLTGKLRLRNITGSTTLLLGSQFNTSSFQSSDAYNVTYKLEIHGRFTLVGTTTIELQHWNDHTNTTGNAGLAASSGENEIYSELLIWKV